MKTISLLLATCAIGLCAGNIPMAEADTIASSKSTASAVTQAHTQNTAPSASPSVQAGAYLASRFAQSNHDWVSANQFIKHIIQSGITNADLLQRAMILSMGAGQQGQAIEIAKRLDSLNTGTPSPIARLVILVDTFKDGEYDRASEILNTIPEDGTMHYLAPFVQGWIDAAQGKANIEALNDNTIQLYHGILISDYLDDHKKIEQMIDESLKVEEINTAELERIGDLYGHIGLQDKAIELYSTVIETLNNPNSPDTKALENKISALKAGKTKPLFKNIETPQDGMAKALLDLARLLANEHNDESARVFAYMALHLSPDMTEGKALLATINTRHEQYEKAIALYNSIPEGDEEYIIARHKIVDIYEETGQHDKALELLNTLSKEQKDVDTLIKIGNLHRHQSNYGMALEAYDKAVEKLGGNITKDYWHLHYVRGMAYEQTNDWSKAEKELQAALAYQPDHPYVLNYLGYAWADQGIHLNKAREMIQRAVDLRPSDGYITDSLGWVMYKNGEYEQAVPVLERAVELLPYDPTINDHLGDAYWRVGRHLEAKFQWKRAMQHSEDSEQIASLQGKLEDGLEHEHKNFAHNTNE